MCPKNPTSLLYNLSIFIYIYIHDSIYIRKRYKEGKKFTGFLGRKIIKRWKNGKNSSDGIYRW